MDTNVLINKKNRFNSISELFCVYNVCTYEKQSITLTLMTKQWGKKLLKRIRQIIGVSANNLSVECLSLAEIYVALAESYVFQTTVKCGWLQRNADLCDATSSD